jgi:hypothetical protein
VSWKHFAFCAGVAGLMACGSKSPEGTDGGPDAGNSADSGIQRGPVSLPFAGDPEGLWWDAPSSTLYMADQETNQVLAWTDAKGIQTLGALPGGVQSGVGLGQLVLTPQGFLAVIVFGFGTNGAIDLMFLDGGSTAVSGLDPTFRRLGLGQDSSGALYESYFVKNGGGAPVGSIAQLSLSFVDGGWAGTETPVVTGLGKPVGVLAQGGNLYITDQATNDFLVVPVSSLPNSSPPVVASGLNLDLISAGPNGTFFTGSSNGNLNQLSASGTETAFASGYNSPRGSAYDVTHNRVFFGNHIQSGGTNQLVIVPGP